MAGHVVTVGDRVSDFAVGDAVFAHPSMERIGTFAERIAINVGDVAPIPTSASLEHAASLPVVALTAWQILVELGGVGPGPLRVMSSGVRRRARRLGVSYDFFFVRADGRQLREIAALVDDGVLRPMVDRVLPFDQTPQALRALSGSGIHGKIVVSRQ